MSIASQVVVTHWFYKQRARALSLMNVGGFLSAVVLPPFNTWLILKLGWREAWVVWIFLIMGLIFPVFFIFYISKPEDKGLTADPPVVRDELDDSEF